MAQDILGAVIEILQADAGVLALVGALPNDRIFGGELPEVEPNAGDQPTNIAKAVVVRFSPGIPLRGTVQLEQMNVDIVCFGEDPRSADELRRVVHQVLHDAERQQLGTVLFHSADQMGSPQALRDPDTHWAFVLEVWRILASECPAP